MQLRITFPFKILRGLCSASNDTVSLEGTKSIIIKAIDPDQHNSADLSLSFKKAVFNQGGVSQSLRINFRKNAIDALGQTEKTLPDFILKRLNDYAGKIPTVKPLLADHTISISLH